MSDILQSELKNALKITVVKNRQGLESIMKAWMELLKAEFNSVPGVDPYHYICELESLGQNAEPYIICLHREESLEAMLVGRRQIVRMPIRLGYLTIMRTQFRQIHVFHGGLLGNKNIEVCSLLLKALREYLNNGDADVAVFNHFHCDSVMYYVIRNEMPFLSLGYSPRIDGHWKMEMPKCIDVFYEKKSSKERQTLRRKIRKLEKSHQVYMKTYSDAENLEEGIAAAASISSKTYQYVLDYGFLDNPQMRSYLLFAARRGWLRIYILYINNEAAAFEWGIKYGSTFFLRTLGFDPKWRDWSVGTVLFLKVLEALCEEGNINYMDFGFGDAEYKKIYGDMRTDTRSLSIFANRFYPRILNVIHQVTVGVWIAATFVANKLGIERKLKRIWRDRLRRKVATASNDEIRRDARDSDASTLR